MKRSQKRREGRSQERRSGSKSAVGPYRPSLLFYARRPIEFLGRQGDARLAELGIRPGRLFVIAPTALVRTLPSAGALSVLETRGGYVLLASDVGARGCVA
jgi:hypothetical protein